MKKQAKISKAITKYLCSIKPVVREALEIVKLLKALIELLRAIVEILLDFYRYFHYGVSADGG